MFCRKVGIPTNYQWLLWGVEPSDKPFVKYIPKLKRILMNSRRRKSFITLANNS